MNIRYESMKISHSIIKEERLPVMEKTLNLQNQSEIFLSEDEGLFVGFGFRKNAYPYTNQSDYQEEIYGEVKTIVLENEYLIATFLPDYGGRLWSLWDKENKENLLYTNDIIRFRNLAIRNAWFSGGVEWNIASIGHSSFTCEPLYVAEVENEIIGKALRMYEYERLRGVTFQMDFWLDEREFLCRIRIDNKNNVMVPMYWWSNIAVEEFENGRVIAPAYLAYKNSSGAGVTKVSIPKDNNIDITYYNDIPFATDYFFDIANHQKKFEANVNKNGVGLLHYSTNRLKGRKLFCWGHNQGAKNWQKFLTKNAGDYIEIQAGIAKTQYECLPMPPNTVWEWIESYSRVSIKKELISGEYKKAVEAFNNEVNHRFKRRDLEELLKATKVMAKTKGVLKQVASGYGAIECEKKSNRIPDHLEFRCGEKVYEWMQLVKKGVFSTSKYPFEPNGYMMDEFIELVEASLANKETNRAYAMYHLGIMYYSKDDFSKAYNYLKKSLKIEYNNYTLFALAYASEKVGNPKCIQYAFEGAKANIDNYSFLEKMIKFLLDNNAYNKILELQKYMELEKLENRIKMYLAYAYTYNNEFEKAKALLYDKGGIIIDDIREGERSIDDLWKRLYSDKGDIPKIFDFRMA